MRPVKIPPAILNHNQQMELLKDRVGLIRANLEKFYSTTPQVSIIIPAYNEEACILKTLSSLSASNTGRTIEIIVVDNNSTDKTGKLSIASGATCIAEPAQGITNARNAGLQIAKGDYILNADADTIYPEAWIDLMIAPLEDRNIALTYGNFSFVPASERSRLAYSVYEHVSDFSRWLNEKFREEAVNVYGFNSAFRRSDGLAVDGFNHPAGTNEDGWLAIKLRNRFNTKLHKVTASAARVWTSDRRIQIDGGLLKAILKRFSRYWT